MKTLLDQILMAPAMTVLFFMAMSFMKDVTGGLSWHWLSVQLLLRRSMRAATLHFIPTMQANYLVSPQHPNY
jgi:uncharacterized membrane protein